MVHNSTVLYIFCARDLVTTHKCSRAQLCQFRFRGDSNGLEQNITVLYMVLLLCLVYLCLSSVIFCHSGNKTKFYRIYNIDFPYIVLQYCHIRNKLLKAIRLICEFSLLSITNKANYENIMLALPKPTE